MLNASDPDAGNAPATENALSQAHLIAPRSLVTQAMRESCQTHRGMVFWLTGLSGSGKSTLAHSVEARLFSRGLHVVTLDGDVIRSGLCRDLLFTPEDRLENNRRVAELAKLFMRSGAICICAFISPSEEYRKQARRIVGADRFREVYVACSPEECERRDVKGFYKKARQGLIAHFTGISAGYDVPAQPDRAVSTERRPEEESINELLSYIISQTAR